MKGTMKKRRIVESSFKLFMCMVIMLVSMPGLMWECDTYATETVIDPPTHNKMVVGDSIRLNTVGNAPATWTVKKGGDCVNQQQLQQEILSCVWSTDLKNYIKEHSYIFSSTELLSIAYRFAPTYNERLRLLQLLQVRNSALWS